VADVVPSPSKPTDKDKPEAPVVAPIPVKNADAGNKVDDTAVKAK
jgi:hypothetical protein